MILFQNEMFDLTLRGHRKSLYEVLEEHLYNETDGFVFEDEEEEQDFQNEYEEFKQLIHNQNEKELANTLLLCEYVNFEYVTEEVTLENTLVNAGYKVNKSAVSRSLYATNDNGEEIRISDHVRPTIVEGEVAIYEHEEGIIVTDNTINSNVLIKAGFSKLESNKDLILG